MSLHCHVLPIPKDTMTYAHEHIFCYYVTLYVCEMAMVSLHMWIFSCRHQSASQPTIHPPIWHAKYLHELCLCHSLNANISFKSYSIVTKHLLALLLPHQCVSLWPISLQQFICAYRRRTIKYVGCQQCLFIYVQGKDNKKKIRYKKAHSCRPEVGGWSNDQLQQFIHIFAFSIWFGFWNRKA